MGAVALHRERRRLRNFLLNEPRGGVFRHFNLLVPPKNPRAQMGFIIMEPEDTPPMSGSNSICVATVLLDSGILPMQEPQTRLTLEAPGGLIEVVADCRDGKAERIQRSRTSLPSSTGSTRRSRSRVSARSRSTSPMAATVSSSSTRATLGFAIRPDEARDLAETGMAIAGAANEQLGFIHPENAGWDHISFCQFAGPLAREDGALTGPNAVVVRPGKIDRSPCGTGCSARMATLHARGLLKVGDRYRARSIIGSTFDCRIAGETQVAGRPAIVPVISGRAWITGTHQHMLDPSDPWPAGYRLADTWPRLK